MEEQYLIVKINVVRKHAFQILTLPGVLEGGVIAYPLEPFSGHKKLSVLGTGRKKLSILIILSNKYYFTKKTKTRSKFLIAIFTRIVTRIFRRRPPAGLAKKLENTLSRFRMQFSTRIFHRRLPAGGLTTKLVNSNMGINMGINMAYINLYVYIYVDIFPIDPL